jgi:hypothetical protein
VCIIIQNISRSVKKKLIDQENGSSCNGAWIWVTPARTMKWCTAVSSRLTLMARALCVVALLMQFCAPLLHAAHAHPPASTGPMHHQHGDADHDHDHHHDHGPVEHDSDPASQHGHCNTCDVLAQITFQIFLQVVAAIQPDAPAQPQRSCDYLCTVETHVVSSITSRGPPTA